MSAHPKPGEIIAGKYLVERLIGVGGMGLVLAAEHQGLGGRVAIKLLLPEALAHEEIVSRFLREGRATARLRSEHIARVLDVGTLSSGAPFLVMEYLEGEDLGAILDARGPLSCADAVTYVLEACEGLAEAHAAGIIHRDIKPANLFLTRKPDGSPTIKLIDFGVSKVIPRPGAEGGAGDITRASTLLGSPRYMSPEQMISARDVDARSDIWSLGAVLYHLVAGRPPFDGDSFVRIYEQSREGPPPLEKVREGAPGGLTKVIERCLAPTREARFANVAELATALAPFAPPEARASADRAARILGVPASKPVPANDLASEIASEIARERLASGAWGATPVPAPAPLSSDLARALADVAPGATALKIVAPRAALPAAPPPAALPPAAPPAAPPPAASEAPSPGSAPAPISAPERGHLAVESAVRDALASFGVAGTVVLRGAQLELHGRGAPVSIDAPRIAEQWPLLPFDLQRRKASELARRLAEAYRASQASMSVPASALPAARLFGQALGAAALLGAAFIGYRAYQRYSEPPKAPVGPRPETPVEQRQRRERVCEAMRANIYKGAPIGPYEVEGWVVELWLGKLGGAGARPEGSRGAATAAPPLRESPAITSAVSGGKLASSADEVLAKVSDGALAIEDGEGAPQAEGSRADGRSVRLVFSGGYARGFFDPMERPRFVALADRLADGAGADAGALYGRCAHLSTRDAGAWFRGRDAGLLASALLYGVGLSAEPRAVDRGALTRFASASAGAATGDFDALVAAASASKLDVASLRALVGEAGGGITVTKEAVTLTFPVNGPLRAVSASRAVAKKLGLGGD